MTEMTDDTRRSASPRAEGVPSDKIAPVQGYTPGIPWSLHLEAYDAYCKKWGAQPALIDLEGRNCRGGFGTGELDSFIPGWRDRVSEIGKLRAEVARLTAALATIPDAPAACVHNWHDHGKFDGWNVSRCSLCLWQAFTKQESAAPAAPSASDARTAADAPAGVVEALKQAQAALIELRDRCAKVKDRLNIGIPDGDAVHPCAAALTWPMSTAGLAIDRITAALATIPDAPAEEDRNARK